MRDNSPSYTHYDGRGDVTTKTDGGGNVTWQSSYEAFGGRTQEAGVTQDRQKANTKDEDPTGLLNEGMRYRDLETGTFITRDPAGFVDGPNLYAYVRQNPWTHFDPLGLAVPTDDDEECDRISDAETQTAAAKQDLTAAANSAASAADALKSGDIRERDRSLRAMDRFLQNAAEESAAADKAKAEIDAYDSITAYEQVDPCYTGSIIFRHGAETFLAARGKELFPYEGDSIHDSSVDIANTAMTIWGGVGLWKLGAGLTEKALAGAAESTVGSGIPMGYDSVEAYQRAWAELAIKETVTTIRPQLGRSAGFGETYGAGAVFDGENVSIKVSSASPYGLGRVNSGLPPGQYVGKGFSLDAELKIKNFANANGLQLWGVGATRPVCQTCTEVLDASGIPIWTPVK
jgi:RHS repeat-associated protein